MTNGWKETCGNTTDFFWLQIIFWFFGVLVMGINMGFV